MGHMPQTGIVATVEFAPTFCSRLDTPTQIMMATLQSQIKQATLQSQIVQATLQS
jgi:hypothetical protein